MDVPFIFEEVTADFQEVTIQGQLTYRVSDPKRLSSLMNYSLTANGRAFESEDPKKLPQRLINHTQVLTRAALKAHTLKQALSVSNDFVSDLLAELRKSDVINSHGIEVLDLSILAIKPMPETARALEAESREQIMRESDEAIYARRNASVEQERAIRENELNTEIAVEHKKRQIVEAQLDAEKAAQTKRHELDSAKMQARIQLEEQNKSLVALATENARHEADSRAYGISATMKALADTDPRTLQALASTGMNPNQLVALAFKELGERADKIGHLNITPELLRELLTDRS